jgi:hypothetical protein
MRQDAYIPEFVEAVPEALREGRLYISKRFKTASHLCACGCGSRVVTPLKPAKWQLTQRGDLVSLSPSIGRWQLPCKSHYWIRDNRVIWSRAFTEAEMQAVLDRDTRALRPKPSVELWAASSDVSGVHSLVRAKGEINPRFIW